MSAARVLYVHAEHVLFLLSFSFFFAKGDVVTYLWTRKPKARGETVRKNFDGEGKNEKKASAGGAKECLINFASPKNFSEENELGKTKKRALVRLGLLEREQL